MILGGPGGFWKTVCSHRQNKNLISVNLKPIFLVQNENHSGDLTTIGIYHLFALLNKMCCNDLHFLLHNSLTAVCKVMYLFDIRYESSS